MAVKHNRSVNLGFAALLIILAAACVGSVWKNLKITDASIGVAEGTFPAIISVLLLILAVLVVAEELMKKRQPDENSVFTKSETLYALNILGLLVFCALMFPLIGFVGAMGLYTFVFMTFISQEKKGLIYRLACAVLIPTLVFLLFKVLYITLPEPFWLA